MNCKRVLRACVVLCLCVVMLASSLQAFAREITLSVEYVPITSFGFVADTLNGVESKYNPWGTNYDCGELVRRYYKQVYGLNVSLYSDKPNVVGNSEYWFEIVEEPKTGDVFFATAWDRGKSYGHWALCKSTDVEKDTITMFEQNWRWNGMAGVGRQISYSNNCYVYYRLTNATGYVLTLEEQKARDAAYQSAVAALDSQLTREEQADRLGREESLQQLDTIRTAAAEARSKVEQLKESFLMQANAAARAAQ